MSACHEWAQWTCSAADCGAQMCRRCDGIPGDEYLCWECLNAKDPEAVA